MHKQRLITRIALMSILLIAAVALSACAGLPPIAGGTPEVRGPANTPGGESTPAPVLPTAEPPLANAAPVEAARQALAQELGARPDDIRILSAGVVEWPNGCLGIEKPGIMCTDAIVPGYQIILEAHGKQYEYRTDLTGGHIERAPDGTGAVVTPEAVLRAQTAAAADLGLELGLVQIISSEKVDWPDPCLGVPDPLELCAQVITPGYRVVLEASGQQVVYHTDETGQNIRRERRPDGETPPAQGSAAVVGLRRDVDGCLDVRIDLEGVMFGACGEEMASGEFLTDTYRLEQLTDLQSIYTSFGASTPAGKVTFVGKGPIEATPVEQRMVAEWANLVAQEVKAGPGAAQYGLGWLREGGIAGFCDDLAVEASGHATLRSCKDTAGTEVSWRRLTSGDLTTFYGWLDQLGGVESEQTDDAVADAMTLHAFLAGHGTRQGSETDKAALLEFGSGLLQQWAEATPVRLIDTLAEVNLRTGPSAEFEVIEKIAAGQQVLVTGVDRGSAWWRVVCPDSTVGNCWMSADAALTQPIVPAGSTGEAPIDETGIL